MIAGNLDTTNVLLGIMAAVSVLQALLLIAAGIMGWRLYSRAMQTVREIEERQVAPLVARANTLMTQADAILLDVKAITSRVGQQTERVDSAIRHTIDRVDDTATRVKRSVAARVGRILGLVHSASEMMGSLFNGRQSSSDAPGHASVTRRVS